MTNPRVLLVDDDEDVRHMTRVALRFEGFDLVTESDGTAGLASARAERPAAIVLDVMMPGRDGIDVLRELRADPGLHDVPVVILTARTGAERDAWEAGTTAYLTKPFTGAALAGTLRRMLAGDGNSRDNALARIGLAERLTAAAESHTPPREG